MFPRETDNVRLAELAANIRLKTNRIRKYSVRTFSPLVNPECPLPTNLPSQTLIKLTVIDLRLCPPRGQQDHCVHRIPIFVLEEELAGLDHELDGGLSRVDFVFGHILFYLRYVWNNRLWDVRCTKVQGGFWYFCAGDCYWLDLLV